jgi:hypothetical protein
MMYFIGLLWLLGAAGGCEGGALSITATIINMSLALLLMWGYYTLKGRKQQ